MSESLFAHALLTELVASKDQSTASASIFGAICLVRGTRAGLG